MYSLVLGGYRDDAVRFLDEGGGNVKNFPSAVVDGRVRTLLPFYDDQRIRLDQRLFEFPDDRLELQTAVRRLWWSSSTTLELTGWAYIDNIDLTEIETRSNSNWCTTSPVPGYPSRRGRAPDPDVSRISRHKWCSYENRPSTPSSTRPIGVRSGDRHDLDVADEQPDPADDGTNPVSHGAGGGLGAWHVDATVTTARLRRTAR